MTSFIKLRDFLTNAATTKSNDPLVYKTLYNNLHLVLDEIKIIPEPELIATSNLAILEDVVNGKNFMNLSKTLQSVIISIYVSILKTAPGYVVRNVLSNLLIICTNKSAISTSRECAALIIGKIMENRSNDCGSMITDMIQNLTKLIKNGDSTQRMAGLSAIQSIVSGAGIKIGDCHNDIIKLAGKYISDKSVDVKLLIANVISEISIHSNGCSTVSAELLLAPAAKGLEDDIAIVQNAFANTFATIFYQQIRTHVEGLQQAKIGLARGESTDATGKITNSPKKTTISKLKELSASVTTTKRGVDEQDFRSIIQHFIKHIIKSNGTLRAGYICSLSYLIKFCLQTISHNDLEWLVLNCISMFKDSTIVTLSYEDMAYFRARISHLLRTSIVTNLIEIQQLKYASLLVQFISCNAENRNDSELQLALGELSHVVNILGEAAVSISDDINGAATIYLRHSAFGVRTAAAYVLASLSTVAPALAAGFLRNSLITAQTQANHLSLLDSQDSDKNKSTKDAERLQRMYFFHGHTLVIAIFLKNENSFPSGIPKDLINNIFNFGITLLQNDVLSAPSAIRHVICSIIRAGSLIVSSCLNLGQAIGYEQIFSLLKQCQIILNKSIAASAIIENQNDSSNAAGDDLLYEIMCLEAALVCISTLLWSNPEVLIHESECLTLVVSCLDTAFQAIKNKYQSKYRTHFRFRILHTILLECFAWLPPGSFPDSCQALFVESLRVFRDSINAGYECTCLSDFLPEEFKMFGDFTNQPVGKASVLQPEIPIDESLLVLRLETNSVALQKKESEAFLASFSTDNRLASDTSRRSLQSVVEWSQPSAPVAQIDSRTINASIALLASTFGHQDNECQEKAVQLCSQGMSQIAKSNTSSSGISMFSSDDEKRKREKKNFTVIRNVVTALCAIIKSFSLPLSLAMNSSLSWGQILADRLFEVLTYPSVEIRCAAAISLGTFAGKVLHTSLLETASGLINDAVTTTMERKENLGDFSGYLIALYSLSAVAGSSKASTKRNITMTLFECLRKVDSPSLFRAHGLLAIGLVVKGISQVNVDDDSSEEYALLERSCHLIELQLVSITNMDEVHLLCAAIQRTVNVTTVVVRNLLQTIGSSNKKDLLIDIKNRLHRVWEVIKKTSLNENVIVESVAYLSQSFHPTFGPLKDIEIAQILKEEILLNKDLWSSKILISTIEGIKLIAKENPRILFNEGIDVILFELLDWCIAAAEPSTNSAYAGLELRLSASIEYMLNDITLLENAIENTIIYLANIDIDDVAMDQRVGKWLLVCRAIVLGVRRSGNDEKQGDESENNREGEDDGGGEFGADEIHVDVTTTKNSEGDILLNNGPWTYTQYVSWCRDQASQRCQNLNAARVKIRAISIKYATILLNKLNNSIVHRDICLGREEMKGLLENISSSPSDDDLSILPCYLSLFIHDIVTMACACMTYTIEDKHVVQLQTESVLLMRKVMSLFKETIDPDMMGSVEDKTPGNNRILMQYMSQLVSAIRQCLTVNWFPVLQMSTCMIICDWIQDGFLTDKVIIRRLLKVMCERFDKNGLVIQSRAPISVDVSDNISTIDHVISCTLIGRLFLLVQKGVIDKRIDNHVQTTIISMIEQFLPKLSEVWIAILIDAARILQKRESSGEKNTIITTWTIGTDETDSRRGGITYCANAEPEKMKYYFEWALPNVLAAISFSPTIKSEELITLFAVSMATLEHINSLRKSKLQNTIDVSNNGDVYIILTLASIAKIDTNNIIPSLQWAKIFLFLNDILLPSTQNRNGMDTMELITQTLSLNKNLMNRYNDTNIIGNSDVSSWIFITSLNIVKIIFPTIFGQVSTTNYSVFKCGDILRSSYKKSDLLFFEMIVEVDRNTNGKMELISNLLNVLVHYTIDMNSLYILNILTAILPLAAIASINDDISRKIQLRTIILNNIQKMIKSKNIQEVQIYSILGEDLLIWQNIFSISCPSDIIQIAVIESILDAWNDINSKSNSIEFLPSQINVLILQNNKATIFCKSALLYLLRLMQSNTEKLGPLIMNSILPSLLLVLDTFMDESYELVVVQIIFFAFNLIEESKKEILITLILVPLINVMSKRSNDSMITQFLGKCLTHLAKTYQDTFRLQVGMLTDIQRQILQDAMRNVLQQQQQQHQLNQQNQQQGGSTSITAIKNKIDVTKFKK